MGRAWKRTGSKLQPFEDSKNFEESSNFYSTILNDSDDTTENLKIPSSLKSSVLTELNSKETNEVAKEH